jgi:tellurite resistance protein TehA-like permease
MLDYIVLAGATLAMAGALEVSGDLIAAATTLAGLVLVFIGATSTGYEGYPAEMRDRALRKRFRRRAWFGFTGFALSVVAAFLALVGKWFHQEWSAFAAVALFIIALIWVIVAAYLSVRDIR